jgi:hypothetical protein
MGRDSKILASEIPGVELTIFLNLSSIERTDKISTFQLILLDDCAGDHPDRALRHHRDNQDAAGLPHTKRPVLR